MVVHWQGGALAFSCQHFYFDFCLKFRGNFRNKNQPAEFAGATEPQSASGGRRYERRWQRRVSVLYFMTMPTLATNPRAKFDYDILKTYEAGIVLTGQEVKSARSGHVSFKGAFATLTNEEVWLLNAHISPYPKAGRLVAYDPTRSRKLLLHVREIKELVGKVRTQGLTLVPISLYTRGRRLKVELGLARGRKKYEKREVIKKRAVEREIRGALKRNA